MTTPHVAIGRVMGRTEVRALLELICGLKRFSKIKSLNRPITGLVGVVNIVMSCQSSNTGQSQADVPKPTFLPYWYHKQTDHGRFVDITCIPTTCCRIF